MTAKYYRLQSSGITIQEMRSWTSDDGGDGCWEDGTICASADPNEKLFGGAAQAYDDDTAEVVVITGVVASVIYDGVRLYSDTIDEVARYRLGDWRRMQGENV